MQISRSLLADLHAWAAGDRNEICGLLFGADDRIEAAVQAANVAAAPADSFEVDPAALIAAHRAARAGGPRPIGHFHSHPGGDPSPSPRDAAAASADGALWLLLGRAEARLWRAVAGGPWLGAFAPVDLEPV